MPTDTPTPVQTREAVFQTFHDYNGNGVWDSREPALADISISANGQSEYNCTTGADGRCVVGLPDGHYHSNITAPDRYQWILPSASKAIAVRKGVDFDVDGDSVRVNLPLGEGRWVFPVPAGYDYEIATWFDRSPEVGVCSNWLGELVEHPEQNGPDCHSIRVEDQHNGIDFFFPDHEQGVPVLAMDAGTVVHVEPDMEGYIIIILTDEEIKLDYGHVTPSLQDIQPGITKVKRGQHIGWTNMHTFLGTHQLVHVGSYMTSGCDMAKNHKNCIDPFLPSRWTVSDYELSRRELNQ